eukprot:a841186_137.p1 GENE.a841186_137~~a841186_137.p1  ORF type:complete len:540 (+),score=233.06 a841186_137:43-1620(+)
MATTEAGAAEQAGMHTTSEGVTEVESLCMNCYEKGTTRILMTYIPHFKEIILMAFECPHCGFRSNEVQSGAAVYDHGVRLELKVEDAKDLNRQMVKSETATWGILELEFENPPVERKGNVNTIEGFLTTVHERLSSQQEQRRAEHPEVAAGIDAFLARLQACIDLQSPFTIFLDDPSGNAHIESPYAPAPDPRLTRTEYKRTRQQALDMGLGGEDGYEYARDPAAPEVEDEVPINRRGHKSAHLGNDPMLERMRGLAAVTMTSSAMFEKIASSGDEAVIPQEVLVMPERCAVCFKSGHVKMLLCNIPFFKDVVIMAFLCESCGYRTTEIKSGGATEPRGQRHTLHVTCPEDLSRDVLKSETASLEIPELGLELSPGTLGGKFTTVEGLVTNIRDQIVSVNPFQGDSQSCEEAQKWTAFSARLDALLTLAEPFTIILDDAVANSYIQNIYVPETDPRLVVEQYDRTWEQNEELGLNDMVTENYGEASGDASGKASGEASGEASGAAAAADVAVADAAPAAPDAALQ